MSDFDRNFSDYRLTDNVYHLAGGLLPEMAGAMGYDLGAEPSEAAMQNFLAFMSPNKELQKNIELTRERMAGIDNPDQVTADWVEDRSGALHAVHRNFASPDRRVPTEIDTAVITGGVARWILRRGGRLEGLMQSGDVRIGRLVVAGGGRVMGRGEHDLVGRYADMDSGELPTEADFMAQHVAYRLEESGLDVTLVKVPSTKGNEVMDAAAQVPGILDGTVMVIGNAPSTVQTAGEFRLAAQRQDESFDKDGRQLFMTGDNIHVARHGEPPATHQNPYTGVGAIVRDALLLRRNQA